MSIGQNDSPRRYMWRGRDDVTRVDDAVVQFGHDSMIAHGSSVTEEYATSWRLEVDKGWVTRRLTVAAHGHRWFRSLDLTRDRRGVWASRRIAEGEDPTASSSEFDPASLNGALDCDLGLCPLTNTMPIRRLGLTGTDVPARRIVVAWVDVPSLRVLRSEQLYSSLGGAVRYEVPDGGFAADLTVDQHGVVVDYPELALAVHVAE